MLLKISLYLTNSIIDLVRFFIFKNDDHHRSFLRIDNMKGPPALQNVDLDGYLK